MPRWLRAYSNEAIEDAVTGLPDGAQRDYRRLLAEEAELGLIAGQAPPANRAMERLLRDHGRPGPL